MSFARPPGPRHVLAPARRPLEGLPIVQADPSTAAIVWSGDGYYAAIEIFEHGIEWFYRDRTAPPPDNYWGG